LFFAALRAFPDRTLSVAMNTTSHGVVACRVRNVTVSGGCHGEANVSVLTQQRGRTLGEFRHQRDAMVTEPRRGQNERWLLRAAVTATSSRFSTPFAMWRNPRPAARHDHAQSQAQSAACILPSFSCAGAAFACTKLRWARQAPRGPPLRRASPRTKHRRSTPCGPRGHTARATSFLHPGDRRIHDAGRACAGESGSRAGKAG